MLKISHFSRLTGERKFLFPVFILRLVIVRYENRPHGRQDASDVSAQSAHAQREHSLRLAREVPLRETPLARGCSD